MKKREAKHKVTLILLSSRLFARYTELKIVMKRIVCWGLGLLAFVQAGSNQVCAWDYQGHRLVNQLAEASLPSDFPAFVRTPGAAERIAFLAGEPDRWRNTPDLALKHWNGPNHYIDLEELSLYGLTPQTLPPLRYDMAAKLALARAAHPDKFPPIDPTMDADHTRELVGFLPWMMTEYYAKLKSEFSYLKAFQEAGGTPEEIANAEANIIYTMGVMGHFVGDASQPLHTTIHHHGWVGPNPNHYTTDRSFHAWIDGGYIAKINIVGDLDKMKEKIHPAELVTLNHHPVPPEEMFQAMVAFIVDQNKLVEPLYQLEKAGKLSGEGALGLEGKPFIEGQLIKSGQLLGDIWYSAWKQAPTDTYLERDLKKRAEAKSAEKK